MYYIKNGRLPLNAYNSQGWAIRASDREALTDPVPIYVDRGRNHEEDENPLFKIGMTTVPRYDPDSNCMLYRAVITDKVAEQKLRDGTWNLAWSPAIDADKVDEEGYAVNPRLNNFTVVDNPAWKNATFMEDKSYFTFSADEETPPKERTGGPLDPTSMPIPDAPKSNELIITINQPDAPKFTAPPSGSEIDYKAEIEALKETIAKMTETKPEEKKEEKSEEKPEEKKGLTLDDVMKAMEARDEMKNKDAAVEEYINTCNAKGIEVKPETLAVFKNMRAVDVKMFTGTIASVQSAPVQTELPDYYNPTDGTYHPGNSAFTAGYPDPVTGAWLTE